jgi:hypothetical protein
MMAEFLRSIRRNWNAILAFVLVYAAITLNLGPAWAIAAWFFNGCGYIIYLALRDP